MLEFESNGITYILHYTKRNGFTYYEEEKSPDNECIIKPITNDKRIQLYKDKNVGYFKELFESERALNITNGDGYIYV